MFEEKIAVYSEIYTKHTVGKMQSSLASENMLRIVSNVL
jgi:hypothetical protein